MADAGEMGRGLPEHYRERQTGTPPAGGAAGSLQEKAQELTSSVASQATEAWDRMRHRSQQAASAVGGRAEGAWDEMTSLMRRYPVATLLVGVAAGLALSRLLGNRGSPGPSWAERPFLPSRAGADYPFAK